MDNDGHADIVVISNDYHSILCPDDGSQQRGLRIFGDDQWVRTRPVWNQHAYHVTNVEEDGSIPAVADLNWLEHNSFRSGDLSAVDGGGFYPDLLPRITEVCEERCADGVIEVWVQIGNQGGLAVEPGTEYALYAVTPDATQLLIADVLSVSVDSGELTATLHLELSGVENLDMRDLELVVDPGDDYNECDEGNNTVRWGSGVCLF